MENNVRGSRPQANDSRWSTALLLSFIVAIALMFGNTSAKTGDNAAAISTTAEAAPAVTAAKANDKTVVKGSMQIAATH